jgi:glycosyltransferase involved in cell wall biosynthesis
MSANAGTFANRSVGIVVPARNEEARIQRCLDSVLEAAEASGARRAFIVVVADRCTDRTVPLVERTLGQSGCVIECDAGAPGTARRLGVEAVLDEFRGVSRSRLWLANTDADSYVPVDWIRRQLQMARDGATAIAGIVAVDSFATHGAHGAATFARHYVLNADGTHPHVHGANIGVRADVYLDAGGVA